MMHSLEEAKKNPIPFYLMSCYAYEELSAPFMADHDFDALGVFISEQWEEIEHPHKHLIDPDTCWYTSGTTKRYHEWPMRILSATHLLTGEKGGTAWETALDSIKNCEVTVDDLL